MASRSLRAVGATRKYSVQLPGQAPDYHDATYHYEVGSDNMTHLGRKSFLYDNSTQYRPLCSRILLVHRKAIQGCLSICSYKCIAE